jgi:carotenoid cleavage dioxygenase-like enzyme
MAIDLAATGAVPNLSGKYAWISEGMVHAVGLGDGRAPWYRNRPTTTAATTVIWFGGSLLAFGDGQLALELDDEFDAVRRVDLAGANRTLTAHPAVDPVTGELHLLTFGIDPAQLHVRVSTGGLTRTVRSIDGAPGRIRQLALTRDHVVLLADGFLGLIERTGHDARATWFPIDIAAAHIAAAHDDGETVVAYATGPSLARWTLQPRARIAHSEALDASTHTFASPPVFVADPERGNTEDGGWLVGLVQDATTDGTDLVVLDAQAIERPALAVTRLPRRVPNGARGTWIPGVPQI